MSHLSDNFSDSRWDKHYINATASARASTASRSITSAYADTFAVCCSDSTTDCSDPSG